MSKRRTTRKPEKKKPARRANGSAARSRVVKPNGGLAESVPVPADVPETVTIGEAMRRAVEELGETVIDPGLAPTQMQDLADCYEDVTRRKAAYAAKAEEAKTAKKGMESAIELLLEKVRSFTHPAPLPLFDQKQAEADHDAMLDGVDVIDF